MPPKKKQSRLPFVTLAKSPAGSGPKSSASDAVVQILDMKFSEGKKYYIRTTAGEKRWISHRQLQNVPHIVAAFHRQQQQSLSHILDSGRRPSRLCGLTTDPATGQMHFVTKWRERDECHLVPSDQMYAKHPQLAIGYLLSLVRVREFQQADVTRLAGQLDANAAHGTDDGEATIWTAFDASREAEKILGTIHYGGKQMFLMKWKNSPQTDLVLADEATERCPHIVINYLEQLIVRRSSRV